jgi:hypothetical protein
MEKGPSAEEAALFGLSVAEASEHLTAEVWPENLNTVNTFIAMATQWRVAMGGYTGLDYAALESVMRLIKIPEDEQREVFEGIRIMESVALEIIGKAKR